MTRLERREVDGVRALRDYLGRVELDGAPMLDVLVPALRETLGMECALAYGVQQLDEEHQRLGFAKAVGLCEPLLTKTFRDYVAQQKVAWGSYNPGRPEPEQRNRVVAWTSEELEATNAPIYRATYAKMGIRGFDQARVLVCDGPSLLGWFGGWQRGRFEAHQLASLEALVPYLRRRLVLERRLDGHRTRPVLDVAMEEIGRAAFVVDNTGHVVHANSIGLADLASDRTATRISILEALRAADPHPRWSVTRVTENGVAPCALVVARRDAPGSLRSRITAAARRWGLTARQRDVLERLAEGNPNQTIAAMLGISERTVEVHLTALFDKAQVENRAELVARVFAATGG